MPGSSQAELSDHGVVGGDGTRKTPCGGAHCPYERAAREADAVETEAAQDIGAIYGSKGFDLGGEMPIGNAIPPGKSRLGHERSLSFHYRNAKRFGT
ncbi:hypothetical protein HC891_18105 [Candidatus Gracilibacteria bacterium]|nr:hypothetical protein [Candidatus Gracilibacteria bacterium]